MKRFLANLLSTLIVALLITTLVSWLAIHTIDNISQLVTLIG